MMQIKLIENTMIDGTPVDAGSTIEVDDHLGRALIFNRKAMSIGPEPEPETLTTAREPEIVEATIITPPEAATAPAQKRSKRSG